ncbi:LPXTG cell wall anchor domain-containing protein [Vagococcus hydrophili]|uniref:LPXTG cell wall anchor domain-containing protein n=1 Tax=Vagococcus hydrophili TaxID=2714947 RepID=A0A6G8AXD1_9ENTE|nr:LPXTG cell wall anchor domain-containing protein [Vagococcus hydrophili]QIL49619.1 LPXTG cell wall anchor domain-containing protein [Vagococcus hydrophili]
MKKNSLRVSALVLACVPLLLGSTTLVNAEETTKDTTETVLKADAADETVKEDEVTAADKDKADEATKSFKLGLKDSPIKTKEGSKGVINLGKLKDKELKGTFETEKPADKEDLVTINEKGEWTALKAGKTDVKLFFKPDTATKEFLKKEYPTQTIGDKIPVENVSFVIDKKDTTTVTPTPLGLTLTPTIKDNKGKITLDYNGAALNADFDILDSKDGKIKLAKDGSFEVLENGVKEKKFNQEVSFKLIKDKNFDAIANSDKFKGKEIKLDYKQSVKINASDVKKEEKVIKITFKQKSLDATFDGSKWSGQGRLQAIADGKIDVTGTFGAIKNDPYLSLSDKGDWEPLKPGSGEFTPGFTIDDASMKKLNAEYPKNELKIVYSEDKIKVNFVDKTNTGGNTGTPGGKTAKDYVPVNKLPQTGEEKMKFAGVIGAVVIVIAGIIFFMKKKKGSDDTEA